ncbi:MAG: hypothetical protein AABX66_02185 [Nanoarchaeota archaeon]
MIKEVIDFIKNGRAFKRIVSFSSDGSIHSVMEKPNLEIWSQAENSIIASGAHVFACSPEQNHIDFFLSGSLISKEYPEIRGSTNYGYNISGAIVVT